MEKKEETNLKIDKSVMLHADARGGQLEFEFFRNTAAAAEAAAATSGGGCSGNKRGGKKKK